MAVITDLIAYWSLEEASGTRNDAHSTNHLTDINTVTQGTGKVGNCADFEWDTAEHLEITDNAPLSTGNIDFSVACWVNLESKAATRGLMGKGAGSNLEYAVVYHSGLDRFRFWISSADGLVNFTTVPADTLGSPSVATWYFVVAWHDATANTINIQVNDGTVDSVAYTFGAYDSAEKFYLGNVLGDTLDGQLDEAGFWKKVLSASERTWLYNSGNGRSYADIVAEAGGGAAPVYRGMPFIRF